MARPLGVQSQQLLPKSEVLQEQFFSGAKEGDDPAEQMSKAHKHLGIIAKSPPGQCAFQVVDSADVQSFGETQHSERKSATQNPRFMLRSSNL